LVRAIKRGEHPHLTRESRHLETFYIGRKRPHEEWVKLNFDGFYKESVDLAGCGGLIRDSNGQGLTSYGRKIGTCDSFHVEIWGMYEGIKISTTHCAKQLQTAGGYGHMQLQA
jgi:hypothetical protein